MFLTRKQYPLKIREMNGTATFVEHVTKMWNILNVRSTTKGFHLNDEDRYPIYAPTDRRLDFLLKMATTFKLMDNSKRGFRYKGLTLETSSALHQTLSGLVEVVRVLLSTGHSYVLLGKIQSDPIEKEFGVYRQSHGGNYFVSAEQIISGLQLQRLRLFSKLGVEIEDVDRTDTDCCDGTMMITLTWWKRHSTKHRIFRSRRNPTCTTCQATLQKNKLSRVSMTVNMTWAYCRKLNS